MSSIQKVEEDIAEKLYFDFEEYDEGTIAKDTWESAPQARRDIWFEKAKIILNLTYNGYSIGQLIELAGMVKPDECLAVVKMNVELPEVPVPPIYSDKPYSDIEKQAFRVGVLTYRNILLNTKFKQVALMVYRQEGKV